MNLNSVLFLDMTEHTSKTTLSPFPLSFFYHYKGIAEDIFEVLLIRSMMSLSSLLSRCCFRVPGAGREGRRPRLARGIGASNGAVSSSPSLFPKCCAHPGAEGAGNRPGEGMRLLICISKAENRLRRFDCEEKPSRALELSAAGYMQNNVILQKNMFHFKCFINGLKTSKKDFPYVLSF